MFTLLLLFIIVNCDVYSNFKLLVGNKNTETIKRKNDKFRQSIDAYYINVILRRLSGDDHARVYRTGKNGVIRGQRMRLPPGARFKRIKMHIFENIERKKYFYRLLCICLTYSKQI